MWSRDRDLNPGRGDLQSPAWPLGYPGIAIGKWRRGGDLNPGGTTPTGLAGRRPTRLGYRGTPDRFSIGGGYLKFLDEVMDI